MLSCSQDIVITFMASLDFLGPSVAASGESPWLPHRQLTSRFASLKRTTPSSLLEDIEFRAMQLNSVSFSVCGFTCATFNLHSMRFNSQIDTHTHTRLFHTSALRKYLHACEIHVCVFVWSQCMQQIVRKFAAVLVALVYGLRQR